MTQYRSWPSLALCLAIGLWAAPSVAQDTVQALSNLAARDACHQPPLIIAFGSSSIEGIGASDPSKNFPSRLPGDMHHLSHADPEPIVLNRGIRGEDIEDMVRRIDHDVIAPKPDMVIWQIGTNDALKNIPVPHFVEIARAGIQRMKAAGIDVVLMEPQRTPVADSAIQARAYLEAVRQIGRDEQILVLPRYDWMTEWMQYYGDAIVASDHLHLSDLGYALLSHDSAEMLVAATRRAAALNPHPDCHVVMARHPA